MREQMRGAASALFISSIALAYLYFFHPDILSTEQPATEQNRATDALIIELEETISELESVNQSLESERQELEDEISRINDSHENADDNNNSDSPIVHAMLEITPGETSSVISERLFDLHIIDSRNAFESDLNSDNRADRIQTGSFFLTSDMDNEDIIEIITNP